MDFAKSGVNELRANFVRCETDFRTDPIKAKFAEAEQGKVHAMVVIGSRDMEAGNVSLRLHGKGHLNTKPKAESLRLKSGELELRAGGLMAGAPVPETKASFVTISERLVLGSSAARLYMALALLSRKAMTPAQSCAGNEWS